METLCAPTTVLDVPAGQGRHDVLAAFEKFPAAQGGCPGLSLAATPHDVSDTDAAATSSSIASGSAGRAMRSLSTPYPGSPPGAGGEGANQSLLVAGMLKLGNG